MSRVQKICKWCGHKITFDKDKYIQQGYEKGRADREKEICDFLNDLIDSGQCSSLNSELLKQIRKGTEND